MENIIQTFTKEEQAILIVALFLLIFALVMSYAMVQDYRI
jgi:LPS O-antigen subunit length determinant protein (WzzB/FepE family)